MNSSRKMLVAGVIGVVFATATGVHALTVEELQAQIQVLYQTLANIQAEIATRTGGTVPVGSLGITGSSGVCLRLTNNLRAGMRDTIPGGPVSALQQFLQSTGDYSYPEITGYFGGVTQSALERYQARAGIVSSGSPDTTGFGVAGPRTRQHIETTSCTYANQVPIPNTSVVISTPQVGACTIDGTTLFNGYSAQLYSTTAAQSGHLCSEYVATRTCTNGALSGSDAYKFLSCSSAALKSCTVGSETIAHGASRTFYNAASVASGSTCSSRAQTRTCTDGALSGSSSYSFTACEGPKACTLDNVTMIDREVRTFYFQEHIPSGELCSSYSLSRVCSSGSLSGDTSYKYASCAPVSPGSCVVDSVVLGTGNSARFYSAGTAPAGDTCSSISQVRTCTNGALSGSTSFNRASCNDTQGCSLDGISLAHASSSVFYSAEKVSLGTTCSSVSKTLTCTNAAIIDGNTYKYAHCAVAPPSSCVLDGAIIATGASATFYNARTVAYGSSCGNLGKTRSCTNGVLGGDAAYKYASCEVNPAPAYKQASYGSGSPTYQRDPIGK